MVTQDRFLGCILGAAIGDALGMPVEMMDGDGIRAHFGEIRDFIPQGQNPNMSFAPGRARQGTWTDDTQRTAANTMAIIESGGRFDMDCLARHYKKVYSSRKNRGWGRSSRRSGSRIQRGIHWSESGEQNGCGNGVITGISPLGLWQSIMRQRRDEFINNCITYAKMTHLGTPAIVSGAVHAISVGLLASRNEPSQNAPPFNLEFFMDHLIDMALHVENDFGLERWNDKISDQLLAIQRFLRDESFKSANPYDIALRFDGGTSYAPNSFGLAYALFARKPNSFDSVFDAVNAGGDTDSNASIVGSLVGALNGVSIIPENLQKGVEKSKWLRALATDFFNVAARAKNSLAYYE